MITLSSNTPLSTTSTYQGQLLARSSPVQEADIVAETLTVQNIRSRGQSAEVEQREDTINGRYCWSSRCWDDNLLKSCQTHDFCTQGLG